MDGLASLSRLMAKEGMVLLKNNGVLPLIHQKVSVFGRIQFDYYQSGTGSGGLVNVRKKYSILEALQMNPRLELNEGLIETYQAWVNEHPFNSGNGMWASEPWSQIEMVLDEKTYKDAAKFSEVAVVFLGRTAGEDKDNQNEKGSYLLTDEEELLLKNVSDHFKETVVVLNVGNLIDMSFIEKYRISACLLAYHGGLQGALAISDLISGYDSPSGKLTDTIAKTIEDYPSNQSFGAIENKYTEDIYVGYRYFNTFKKEAILYSFGFGLTYTSFKISLTNVVVNDTNITINGLISNVGKYASKQVIQVYVKSPQGVLGKPDKELAGYHKTNQIKPAFDEVFSITIDLTEISSYDEEGRSGYPSSYVLESGDYHVYIGFDSLDLIPVYKYHLDQTYLVKKVSEALRPVVRFERIKPRLDKNGYHISYEEVPIRKTSLKKRIIDQRPITLLDPYVSNLSQVYENRALLNGFIASLSEEDLICLTRGEGMSSPKVTPGTACAFGGVTDELMQKGYPILCGSDGPSGIRMDSGYEATSIPIGTLLASSFNESLVSDLYYGIALEMQNYDIELLLAPGMNIHRHPLNGRNFEYFSEDPYLTGHMAKAVINGLDKGGVTGSLKHFACNNQEHLRFDSNAIVSERALREIYLKGFELAIKHSNVKAIMTAYNPINGIWAASNYDLNTTILRHDFNFKGIVITDWWAKMNDDQDRASKDNTAMMIRAQNDIYMVITDAKNNSGNDNTKEMLDKGHITRGELERIALNITRFVLDSYTYRKQQGEFSVFKENEQAQPQIEELLIDGMPLEGFRKDVMVYHSEKNITVNQIRVITKHDIKIESNSDTILIQVGNKVIYQLTSKPVVKESMALNFTKTIPEKTFVINKEPWGKTTLELERPFLKSQMIIAGKTGLTNCLKNEYVYYAIDVLDSSKYIVEFRLQSQESSLSQMPFSVLIENTIKQTITSNGTDGQEITVSAQIIIEKGIKYLGLRFNRSGLQINEISLIRHY
jgi:beta-glucosidase